MPINIKNILDILKNDHFFNSEKIKHLKKVKDC